ncbi:hypothetical protein HDU82_006633 [Entophlyctis luteolus]|nr:hypothetical protein HDU82_006633 [Entophlyctis luteolus]
MMDFGIVLGLRWSLATKLPKQFSSNLYIFEGIALCSSSTADWPPSLRTSMARLSRAVFGARRTSLSAAAALSLNTRNSVLHTDPDAIKAVHVAYLNAGADIIITSSYQASLAGFVREGFSSDDAKALMRKSTALALQARREFLASDLRSLRAAQGKNNPLVAANLGGHRGTGAYDEVPDNAIYRYHEERMRILDERDAVTERVDLLIFETIPTLREAKIISDVLANNPDLFADVPAWISFRGKENGLVGHGETIYECVSAVARNERIAGVGVNCTKPEYVSELLVGAKNALQHLRLDKALFCYPNSGEEWDEAGRCWIKDSSAAKDVSDWADEWVGIGATAVAVADPEFTKVP